MFEMASVTPLYFRVFYYIGRERWSNDQLCGDFYFIVEISFRYDICCVAEGNEVLSWFEVF